jgi:hypothetical protein
MGQSKQNRDLIGSLENWVCQSNKPVSIGNNLTPPLSFDKRERLGILKHDNILQGIGLK